MKKPVISRLFLYRHRFVIGYILLGLAFLFMLLVLPLIAPNGLSAAEMGSTVKSHELTGSSMLEGSLVDAPYHLLQKLSVRTFGLTSYAIKLPSILIGALLGLLLILLLNRWFKSNVAIIASVLAVLSSSFLSIAGSGTPLVMVVFWPTLLLWLGSKIQGVKKPSSFACFVFALALLGSIFTPYLIYLAVFIVIYALAHPHLRFTIRNLPKVPFILISLIVAGGLAAVAVNAVKNSDTVTALLFMKDFSWRGYFSNIKEALLPFFSWSGLVESVFLAPLIGLASFALAVIGLISTRNGFFASRNSIATYLAVFTIIISGLDPDFAILLILPLAILMAHGVKYILNKWYGLFPENPYARIFGIFPIALFLGIMIVSDLSHFVFGYRYSPAAANQFTSDLVLINEELEDKTTLLVPADTTEYKFYKLLEDERLISLGSKKHISVASKLPSTVLDGDKIATLGKWSDRDDLALERIVTNERSGSADRLYIYRVDVNHRSGSELQQPAE